MLSFGFQGPGLRVSGLGSRVFWCFKVEVLRVQGLGSLGFRVEGLGVRV